MPMHPEPEVNLETLAKEALKLWAKNVDPVARPEPVLHPITGGMSGAAIYQVDITNALHGQIANGRYVLKVARQSQYSNYNKELKAHDCAYTYHSSFAAGHIPKIITSVDLSGFQGYAFLYAIAGASLDAYVSLDGREIDQFRLICTKLVREILDAWTEGEPRTRIAPHELLERWLGYRLDQVQAPALHEFVYDKTEGRLIYTEAGEVLINPLRFYEKSKQEHWREITVLDGLLHGDLHGGNILAHRWRPVDEPYWLLDFEHSSPGPIGYDQSYLELAQALYSIGDGDPALLITVLKNLDSPSNRPLLPPGTAWLYERMREMRGVIDNWRDSKHMHRVDDINRQFWLSRIAAGINWANKPGLSERQKYTALCYGGWAAREYLRQHEQVAWQNIKNLDVDPNKHQSHHTITDADQQLWQELWALTHGFDRLAARFVLVAEAQHDAALAGHISALGQLPWSAVIDLDPASDAKGLRLHAAPVLESMRGLHTFDRHLPSVDYRRGTAWMMAAGWESRGESATDYTTWRYTKVGLAREFAQHISKNTAPDPLYVIVLPGHSLDDQPLRRAARVLLEFDEAVAGRAHLILLGSQGLDVDVQHKHLPLEPRVFLEFVANTFGVRARTGVATVPGKTGDRKEDREIPINQLRTLQENLEVVHSAILEETELTNATTHSSFWRGAPPTWADLQQGVDIPRTITPKLIAVLRDRLKETRNQTVVLYHRPGAGATTVAYRVAWELHTEYPTVILLHHSDALSARLQMLYRISQATILLIAESPALTESQREELYRDLVKNNTPVVMLYMRRGFQDESSSDLSLGDPMDNNEAKNFYQRYKALINDFDKIQELERITTDDTLIRYRTPFFYGLITHERDFMAVDRYVASHLTGARGPVRDVLEYLALVTIYSNTGLPETLIKLLLGVAEDARFTLPELFGEGPARLLAVRMGRVRLMHQVIAEEVLTDLTGGGKRDEWPFALHRLSMDMIKAITSLVGPDAQVVTDLFRQLFLDRISGTQDELEDRRDFAPIIERIDSIDHSLGHQVLKSLTDYCPREAHFWNHLGRHQVYQLRRDYDLAEEYLNTAIRLSPDDYVHYHTLGVVLRSRVRERSQQAERAFNAAEDNQADHNRAAADLLESVTVYFHGAASAFERSRALNPENIYGYITHIQLILGLALSLKRLIGAKHIGDITLRDGAVGEWLAENVPLAQKLLYEADQLYSTLGETETFVTQCKADMRKLYGDLDYVIQIWEMANAGKRNNSVSRRALAHAYLARSENRWSRMQQSELRRIVALMQDNIKADGRRDEDYRLWFEAYRMLPEFDIGEALAQLKLWGSYFPTWRAYFYMYILYFYLWYSGRSDATEEMLLALEKCQQSVIGRRSHSIIWLGHEPKHCPLVSAEDLGDWDKRTQFWQDAHQLRRANGIIDDPMIGPQAGNILIDGRIKAFFVPAAGNFYPHQDENKPVNFYLGFSPIGLRAWEVKAGHLPNADRQRVGPALPESVPTPNRTTPPLSERDKLHRAQSLRIDRVAQFIDNIVNSKASLGAELTVEELEKLVEATFGIDNIAAALGFSIRSFLEGNGGYELVKQNGAVLVKPSNARPHAEGGPQTISGHIADFSGPQGYGHIAGNDGRRYYFRRSHLLPEFSNAYISVNQQVEFQPDKNERGLIALKIKLFRSPDQPELTGAELRNAATAKALQILDDSLAAGRKVRVRDLINELERSYPGSSRLAERLGSSLPSFIKNLPGVHIVGAFPDDYAVRETQFVFGRVPDVSRELVRDHVRQLLLAAEEKGIQLTLSDVGERLHEKFPGKPVYGRLGYDKLNALLRTFPEFRIISKNGKDFLVRANNNANNK